MKFQEWFCWIAGYTGDGIKEYEEIHQALKKQY